MGSHLIIFYLLILYRYRDHLLKECLGSLFLRIVWEVGGFDRRAIERRSRRERVVAGFPPPSYGRLLVLPITVQFTRSLGRGRSGLTFERSVWSYLYFRTLFFALLRVIPYLS
jgi:hypothetical protein|uniref:Uncharacterized protein n=1 Tax=Picea glauca TaxID=3330 RepID=A0A124GNU0_PICGL|nr:hypothetical protein ABT39_MTgene3105 [Picea glauca]QHR86480.1 hypothetical protein Q903MT_gene480 [Picea sitchensis]